MNIADVNEAFGLLAERRRLKGIQSTPNLGLHHVGHLHDEEAIAAVLPAYTAEIARRVSNIEAHLTGLGVVLVDDAEPTTQPEG